MKLTEISGLIEEGMWNYGILGTGKEKEALDGPKIREITTVAEDGFSAHRLDLSILTGTYLETGAHILENVRSIDEVSVGELFLSSAIIKIPKGKREHITREDLEKSQVKVEKGDALVIYTGWDRMWNKEGFMLESPHFEAEAMDWVVDKGVKILAGDTPCYDDANDPKDSQELPQLRKLYLSGALALAPIVNGDKVNEGRAHLIVLPLKVKGVCATPCRAVVVEGWKE